MNRITLIIVFFAAFITNAHAVAKSWVSGTAWQTAVWSPAGIPTSGDAVTIAASTFTLDGTVNAASIAFSGTAATSITITGTVNVSGIFDINSLDRNRTFTVNAGSSIVNIGTLVYPTQGTSTYNLGTNGQLNLTSMLTLSTRDAMVLTGNAVLTCNGGIVDAAGSMTLSSTSRVKVGVRYEVQSASVVLTAGSTIEFISATTVIETGGGVNLTFSNVVLTAGLTTFSSPITVAGSWTNNGGSFTSGANTLTFTGTTNVIGGTTTTTFNAIIIANAASYTMNNSNSCTSLTFNNGATNSSLTQASGVVFTINGAVTLNQPSNNNTTRAWNINDGTATVSGLITFAGGSGTTTRVALININNGILNTNGGITFVTSASATKQIVMSGGTTGIVNLKGALTVPATSSTLTAGTSSTFNYCDATSAQTINYFSAGAYNNLSCNNTSAAGATLSAAISATNVTGNLSVQTGTLTNATFAIVGNAAKTFSVSNGATFKLTGTSAMPTGFGTFTLGTTSTCDFNGSGTQTIAAHNYGNLTSSNTGARTLVSAGTIGIANVFTKGTNVYTVTGSSVNFNGSGAQTIPAFTFNNLTVSTGGTKTLSGAIDVNNDLTITSPAGLDVSASNFAINVKRNWTNTGTFTCRAGTVSFTGSAAQAISGTSVNNFYNISLAPAITGVNVSFSNSANIINDFAIAAPAVGTHTVTLGGNVTLKSTSSAATARISQITNPSNVTFSGNLNVERFALGGTTGWTTIGSNGVSGTFADWDDDIAMTCVSCPDGYSVQGTNFASLYIDNEALATAPYDNNRYVEITSTSQVLNPAKGYWVYFGDGLTTTNNIVLDQSGTTVYGNKSITITKAAGVTDSTGWNLVANPYPSPIDWDLVLASNTNLDNQIQVFNPDFNDHATYAGGVGTKGLDNNGTIPMGQAFYVHSTKAGPYPTSQSLNFLESHKSGTRTNLLRTTNQNVGLVFRLRVDGDLNQDETVIHFNPNASAAWDMEYDAANWYNMDPAAVNISSVLNDKLLAINGLPELTSGSIDIPILVSTGTAGTFTISPVDVNNLSAIGCVILHDNINNVDHDLKSNSPYVVYISDTCTVANFYLRITTNNNLVVSTSEMQPTCNGQATGYLTAVANGVGPWNYYWKDADGNTVKTSLNSFGIDTLSNLNPGVYTVEVNVVGTCDNAISSFTLVQPPILNADFTISQDTVVLLNGVANVDLTNNSANADTYIWNFGDSSGSSLFSPSHQYTYEGIYQIELTALNSICTEQHSILKNIVVTSPSLQIISSVTDLTCVNKAEGKIIAYGDNVGPWDFVWLDGANAIIRTAYAKTNPDTLENLAAGVYTLRMRNQGAANDVEQTFNIEEPLSPLPSFTLDNDTLDLNLGSGIVNFSNSSLNADSYFWDFGDSTSSQLSNPNHTYNIGGTYVITMYAFNAACGDSVASYEFVEVIDAIVGLKDLEEKNVSIGQNSAGEVFVKFKYDSQTSITISIYNTLGAKIMNDVVLNSRDEIVKLNIPEMSEQLLLVEVKAENHKPVVKKVIKRK